MLPCLEINKKRVRILGKLALRLEAMKFGSGDNKVSIEGPCGTIEAILAIPANFTPTQTAMIICHPHSLHGGSMGNKVVHTLAKTALAYGLPTLRFNFRGVGASSGEFDSGDGEGDDLLAVWQWLAAELPGFNIILAGFSFGAFVSLKHLHRVQAAGLISVAPPLKRFDFDLLTHRPTLPWRIIAAEEDELIAIEDIHEWVAKLGVGDKLVVVPAASHFFHGKLPELSAALKSFLAESFGIDDD